jgi:hypothetical protein
MLKVYLHHETIEGTKARQYCTETTSQGEYSHAEGENTIAVLIHMLVL